MGENGAKRGDMARLTIILFTSFLLFLTYSVKSQVQDTTWSQMTDEQFFRRYSPLDYLQILKADFKQKDKLKFFPIGYSPDNWVKEEHVPRLFKLIYSTDSTKSVMSIYSSDLIKDKFSSVGREAQNLIECFRTKKRYPSILNSFGPPDKIKAREIEMWWAKYKSGKP